MYYFPHVPGREQTWNVLGTYTGGRLLSVASVLISTGFYVDMPYYSDKHRWLKKERFAGLSF